MMRNLFTISSLFSVIILISGTAVSTSASAEQTPTMLEGYALGEQPNEQNRFSGRLDGINDNGRTVVIDDTLIDLSPIITIDGVSVSRERLKQKLEEGQTVEFSLSGDSREGRRLTEVVTQ